jgi:hypothetical protein
VLIGSGDNLISRPPTQAPHYDVHAFGGVVRDRDFVGGRAEQARKAATEFRASREVHLEVVIHTCATLARLAVNIVQNCFSYTLGERTGGTSIQICLACEDRELAPDDGQAVSWVAHRAVTFVVLADATTRQTPT